MDTVAAYVRVSTERQAEEKSHVRQRETIEEWAESNLNDNVEIEWFADIAESGQKTDRNEFEDMMDNCQNYDAVVVRELSRFGRSLRKVLNDIDTLDDHGVDFVSVKDKAIDTTSAQGKLMFQIMGAFNEFWANLSRERQEEWLEKQKEKGNTVGRPKKLSEEQIDELVEFKEETDSSYQTLSMVAKQKWDIDVTRKTIARYFRQREEDS